MNTRLLMEVEYKKDGIDYKIGVDTPLFTEYLESQEKNISRKLPIILNEFYRLVKQEYKYMISDVSFNFYITTDKCIFRIGIYRHNTYFMPYLREQSTYDHKYTTENKPVPYFNKLEVLELCNKALKLYCESTL